VTRTFCQPSSTRRIGAGKTPEKTQVLRARGRLKETVHIRGARKLITDSNPTASGRDSGAEIEMEKIAADFAALGRRAEEKEFRNRESRKQARLPRRIPEAHR